MRGFSSLNNTIALVPNPLADVPCTEINQSLFIVEEWHWPLLVQLVYYYCWFSTLLRPSTFFGFLAFGPLTHCA